jgi:hypothetical protein
MGASRRMAVIAKVEGGFLAFESVDDYAVWRRAH